MTYIYIYIYIYTYTHIHTTILASIGQDSERWEITYSILWAITCFNVKERWNKGNTGISMWVSTCSKQFVMTFICKNPYEIIVIHRKSLWIWWCHEEYEGVWSNIASELMLLRFKSDRFGFSSHFFFSLCIGSEWTDFSCLKRSPLMRGVP